ncbi:hypothetical protein A8B74_07430 [Sulfitobacter geojensis]|nr:hypothetical protein A8B74_07430 [Sulfitobacter geojensis]
MGAKRTKTQLGDFKNMARNKTPIAKARLLGADVKHPERYADQPEPNGKPLGPAPAHLTAGQRDIWAEYAADMPWLTASDKHIVALAVMLTAKTHETDCPMGYFAQLRLCLASMGGTPVDYARVKWAGDEPQDPASEFLN